jgi:hypothetical protein
VSGDGVVVVVVVEEGEGEDAAKGRQEKKIKLPTLRLLINGKNGNASMSGVSTE